MQTILVVVLGPASAGKTSFIRAASDTDEAEGSGCIKVEDDLELHLYRALDTAPADATLALEAMWQVQATFATGYVLLLDSHRPETFHEGKTILDTFLSYTPVPFVVALNRRADTAPVNSGAVRGLLGLDQNAKILPCVVTDPDSVRQVVLELLYSIIEASNRQLPDIAATAALREILAQASNLPEEAMTRAASYGPATKSLNILLDGPVEPIEGECGLQQVSDYALHAAAMTIAEGPPSDS